jgi:hypothetical protein
LEHDAAVILGLTQLVGPDDIRTLTARYRHCHNVDRVEGSAAALALYQALLSDMARLAPHEEEMIFDLRVSVAAVQHLTGDLPAAIAGFDSVATDRQARYGADDDLAAATRRRTQTVRDELAAEQNQDPS